MLAASMKDIDTQVNLPNLLDGIPRSSSVCMPGEPMTICKNFLIKNGRFPSTTLRKPRFKKGVTCLRNKQSQYGELTKALDLLLDGPSINDT